MPQQQWSSPVRRPRKLLGLLLIYAVSLIGAEAAAASYTVVDLGTLDQGSPAVVGAPNLAGSAVGAGKVRGGKGSSGRRGILFGKGAAALHIAGPGQSDDTAVFALNDAGSFVGSANTATAVRAFAAQAGVTRELPPLAGDNASAAYAVNNREQAVGFSSGPDGQRAVIWENGTPRALPSSAAMSHSQAIGINERGDVAGVTDTAAGPRAVLWPGGQVAKELPPLAGYATSEAFAINARGDVVGYSAKASGARRATSWPAGGGVIDLGALPGGDFSQAFGSNRDGDVVGSSESSAGYRAFLWTRTGGLQDLNSLIPPSAFVLTKATGINNAGMIVAIGHEPVAPHGSAGHSHEETHDLEVRVFLLVP